MTPPARQFSRGAIWLALLFAGCANRGMEAPDPTGNGGGGDTGGTSAGGTGGGVAGSGGATGTGGISGSGGTLTGTGGVAGSGGAAGRGGGSGGSATGGIGGTAGSGGGGGVPGTGGATGGTRGTGGSAAGAAGMGGGGGAGGGAAGSAGAGGAPIPLFAYYTFDQTSGPTITDSSGNGHNGMAQGAGVTFTAGQIGNSLDLANGSGTNYVSLPANLLQTVNDLTITAWVRVRTDSTWARVFDFGSGTTKYMFLTSHALSSGVRFAITTTGNGAGAEQQLTGPSALPVGTWTHVAVVLEGTSNGTLYVNAAPVSTSTSIALRPSSLGATPNDWLGRSQYPDPYFDGQIDDLRIYDRALTAAQIQSIYSLR